MIHIQLPKKFFEWFLKIDYFRCWINISFILNQKIVEKRKPQPFGRPVVHLTAIVERPVGQFIKQNKPIFTAKDVDSLAEDSYIWC